MSKNEYYIVKDRGTDNIIMKKEKMSQHT